MSGTHRLYTECRKGRQDFVQKYRVFVDDNFHYMDEEHRYEHGSFDDCESAIAACKKIVDEFLLENAAGKSSAELYSQYAFFGEDPYVFSEDGDCKFSARDYASRRCQEICDG